MAEFASLPTGGFCFENCQRNEYLKAKGFQVPKCVKTGTTIVGLKYKDGVILGADTRSTEGSMIADKNCTKIHFLAPNIYCCGAGTAADTEMTTKNISSQLELHHLATGRTVPVCTANRLLRQMLFRYQGYIGAALVLGGVDLSGPHLYCIHPHGSSDSLPFVTMGSGSLAATAMLESIWKPEMTLEEGKKLVRDAVAAGIFNDLLSGSNVDICVINKEGVNFIRPYEVANEKGVRQGSYKYQRGTTAVLSKTVIPLVVEETTVHLLEQEPMDTSSV